MEKMMERREVTVMLELSDDSKDLINTSKATEDELFDWLKQEGIMIGSGMTMEFLRTKVK